MATLILKSLIIGYIIAVIGFHLMFSPECLWTFGSFGCFMLPIIVGWPAILIVSGLVFLVFKSIEEHQK